MSPPGCQYLVLSARIHWKYIHIRLRSTQHTAPLKSNTCIYVQHTSVYVRVRMWYVVYVYNTVYAVYFTYIARICKYNWEHTCTYFRSQSSYVDLYVRTYVHIRTVGSLMILQVNSLLETLEWTDSAQHKGHFTLYNCLVLGHTKYNSVQLVYCNPFSAKPFHGCHRLWFKLQVLMMEPSWSRQIQFGMQGVCSFSLPHRKPTQGWKCLTVHSCWRWKHMTIPKTAINIIIVIIVIIDIIDVIVLILVYWCYCNYW